MDAKDFSKELNEKGLKVTTQRIAVLDAIISLNNHPTAENIMDHIRKIHPNISSATIYKVLDVFVSNGLIRRVDTERDIMRYDAITESHHHIYCSDSGQILDFHDKELSTILKKYFSKKPIPGFKIEDLRLQISGKYSESHDSER